MSVWPWLAPARRSGKERGDPAQSKDVEAREANVCVQLGARHVGAAPERLSVANSWGVVVSGP